MGHLHFRELELKINESPSRSALLDASTVSYDKKSSLSSSFFEYEGSRVGNFSDQAESFSPHKFVLWTSVSSELQIQGEEMPTKCIFEATLSCYIPNEGNCMFILSKDKRME